MKTLLITLMAFSSITMAAEKISNLPAAVQKTVKEETRNATNVKVSKETEDGKTVYEVESKVNGRGRDLMIDSAGTVLSIEEEVTLAGIPAAAKAAIEKMTTGGKISKVEIVTKGKVVVYEAAFSKGGKKSEVMVNADGSEAK